MRPSLLHPLTEKRHPGRRRARRLAALAQRRASSATHTRASVEPTAAAVELQAVAVGELTYDTAARRVREAGGPLDEACYPCACGYFFIAPVSTSVSCPHCGTTQAW